MSDKKKETSPGPSRKDMLQYAKALVLFVPCFELKKKMLDQLAEFSTGAPSEAPGIYNEANQHGAEMHLEGLRLIKLLESKGYLPNGSTGKKSDNTLMNETMVMTMINATGQEVLEKLDSVYTDVTDGNPAAKCKLETILFIFAGHGCTRVTKRGDTAPTEGSEAMKADFTVKRLRQILCTHDIDTDNVGTTALHDIDLFERLNKFMIFKPEINATCIISACWAVPAGLDDEKAELAAANYTPYLVGERTLAATAAKVNPAARLTVLQTAFGGLSYNVRLHLDRPTTVTADSPPIIMSTVLTPLATVVKESTKVLSHKELATLMLSKDMGAKIKGMLESSDMYKYWKKQGDFKAKRAAIEAGTDKAKQIEMTNAVKGISWFHESYSLFMADFYGSTGQSFKDRLTHLLLADKAKNQDHGFLAPYPKARGIDDDDNACCCNPLLDVQGAPGGRPLGLLDPSPALPEGVALLKVHPGVAVNQRQSTWQEFRVGAGGLQRDDVRRWFGLRDGEFVLTQQAVCDGEDATPGPVVSLQDVAAGSFLFVHPCGACGADAPQNRRTTSKAQVGVTPSVAMRENTSFSEDQIQFAKSVLGSVTLDEALQNFRAGKYDSAPLGLRKFLESLCH